MEEAADGHGSLVARLTRHARLHRAHSHVPEREGVAQAIRFSPTVKSIFL